MSMLSRSDFFNKRLFLLAFVIGVGGMASMAKSFDIYGYAVVNVEHQVGGDRMLHMIVSTALGFVAAWATPKRFYQTAKVPVSPWVWLLLFAVSIDEFSQAYFPLREFSLVDLAINLCGVSVGSVIYLVYASMRYFAPWRK